MPYIDNRFYGSDRNFKTVSPQKIKKNTTVCVPQGMLSNFNNVELLKSKARIRSTYNDICKRINLNEQIRPELEFDTMSASAAGGFNPLNGKICFDEDFIMQLDNKKAAFIIRHELEHVKQFHNIARMLGLKKFVNLIVSQDENCSNIKNVNYENINIDYYKKVLKLLGKIDKDSEEGIRTQKYIDAYKKYPDMIKLWERTDICKAKKIFLFAKEFILNYKFNFLETEANKAAKNFLKSLKV